MIASLTATAVALAVGLPIVALGETLRGRAESAMKIPNTASTRKAV